MFVFIRKLSTISKIDIGIVVGSVLLTLVNPYGFGLWQEIYQQIRSPLVHRYIQEWGYFISRPEMSHIFAACLMGFFIWKFHILKNTSEKVITIFLFLLSLYSLRHIPYFLIWTLFILPRGFESLEQQVKHIKNGTRRLRVFYRLLISLAVFLLVVESTFALHDAYLTQEQFFYPKEATLWLKKQPISGHIFSLYEWGGYLDWKFPQQKVFIDGRMPHMQWDGPFDESSYAFADYVDIANGKHLEYYRTKFHIEYILLRRPVSVTLPKILQPIFQVGQLDLYNFLDTEGWSNVYQDDISVLYYKEL